MVASTPPPPLTETIKSVVILKKGFPLTDCRISIGEPIELEFTVAEGYAPFKTMIENAITKVEGSHELAWPPAHEIMIKTIVNSAQKSYVAINPDNFVQVIEQAWANIHARRRDGVASFKLEAFVYLMSTNPTSALPIRRRRVPAHHSTHPLAPASPAASGSNISRHSQVMSDGYSSASTSASPRRSNISSTATNTVPISLAENNEINQMILDQLEFETAAPPDDFNPEIYRPIIVRLSPDGPNVTVYVDINSLRSALADPVVVQASQAGQAQLLKEQQEQAQQSEVEMKQVEPEVVVSAPVDQIVQDSAAPLQHDTSVPTILEAAPNVATV